MERIWENERPQTAPDQILRNVPIFTGYCQLHQSQYRILQGLCIEFHVAWKWGEKNWRVIRLYQERVPGYDSLEQCYCRWDPETTTDRQKAPRTRKWQYNICQHVIGSNGSTCAIVIYLFLYSESSSSSKSTFTKTKCKGPQFSRSQYKFNPRIFGECLTNSETLLLFQ